MKQRNTRSRRPSSSRRASPPGKWRRFFQAAIASAAFSFSIASCTLNPDLRDSVSLQTLLDQWGIVLGDASHAFGPEAAGPVPAAGEYVQTSFAACPHFFPAGGMPRVPSSAQLRELCYDAFAILHSGSLRTPVFAVQRLNRNSVLKARGVSRKDRFFADARLPAAERAELDDYRGSGYSRGHMAPAADMPTNEAMAQSFSLANMVPQNQTHNGGAWAQIEADTRKYVLRARGDVYVFTGPVYGSGTKRIGNGRVAVPTHLYKLVHDATTGRSWVHWQENSATSRPGPPITYAEFVRRTGLHLLPEPGALP